MGDALAELAQDFASACASVGEFVSTRDLAIAELLSEAP